MSTNWLRNTGTALQAPGAVIDCGNQRWTGYYTLEPIMAERTKTPPLATNESLNASGCSSALHQKVVPIIL